MPRMTRLIISLALVLATGCGRSAPDMQRVRGTVTAGGTTVPTGMVTFVAKATGSRHSGEIGPDGTYELEAPAGRYGVAVVAVEELPTGPVTPHNWREAFSAATVRRYVPEVFGDPETSPLHYDVEGGRDNTYDIAIPGSDSRGGR
jgi:hypothetical protein